MATQDENALLVSWPGIVALVVAALGLIVSRPSLVSPRPTPAAADGKTIPSGKGVPARLWQDPLMTALRGGASTGEIAAVVGEKPAPPDEYRDREPKVLFLFECLEPENTPEAAETRRRERYAVLSALNTAGYTPTHPDRIFSITPSPRLPSEALPANGPQPKSTVDPAEEQKPIPYEWVTPLPKEQRADNCRPHYQAVCVLWVSPRPDSKDQLQCRG